MPLYNPPEFWVRNLQKDDHLPGCVLRVEDGESGFEAPLPREPPVGLLGWQVVEWPRAQCLSARPPMGVKWKIVSGGLDRRT